MKHFIPLFLLLIAILSSACGGEVLPDPKEGEVLFYFDGKIDGQAVKWEAGKSKYYMAVNPIPNFLAGESVFFGKLQNAADSTRDALEIYFDNPNIQSAAMAQAFFVPSPQSYVQNLVILVNDSVKFTATAASTYSWDFGDGSFSTKAQPTHLFPNPTQAYTVTLYTQNNNGCKSQITQHVTPSKVSCREGFTFANVNGLERQIQFQSSQDCFWDFGDGSPIVSGKTPIHLYASKGVFTVTATQDSGFACHQKVTENVKVGNITACASNFSSEITPQVKIRFVTINYRDANGILYSSSNALQPSNAFFTILKVEDYIENQQKIKKLTLGFACKVSSDSGDTHFIEGEKTIWGVQVP